MTDFQSLIRCWARAACVTLLILSGCRRPPTPEGSEVPVTRGTLTVWTPCDGTLEARRVETLMSRFQGRATIVDLVPEGAQVRQGDVLVRLDASQLENDLVKLQGEFARTSAELDALENATIPLEKQDLDAQIMDLKGQADAERQILADTRELVDRKLISRHEIEQQEAKVAGLSAKAAQLAQHKVLAESYLHPAKLLQARAAVEAVRQQILLAQQQLSNCVITAPSSGLTVYPPIHVGSEFRSVRIGDTLYPNQPFLCIPDMDEFTVPCFIPESDLARVQPGMTARVAPLAYADALLEATVESVGVMAQSQPGAPAWQKYFRVVIRVEGHDPRLRPGMSTHVEVCSCNRKDTLLIPRVALTWNQGNASCQVRTPQGLESRTLKLGWGDDTAFEVLSGVVAGDLVSLP